MTQKQMTVGYGPSKNGIRARVNDDGSVSYQAQVRMLGFEHKTKTFHRKTDAKRWIEDTKTRLRDRTAMSSAAERTTLHTALEQYLNEVTPNKKGAKREQDRVKAWMAHPLAKRYLTQLDGSDFATYRDQRRTDGVADGTIRLELAIISHLYTIAVKEKKMTALANPIKAMTMPKGSKSRTRRLNAEEREEERLLAALADSPTMVALVQLAIETAMRQGELLGLKWGDVDLQKGVATLHDTKNGDERHVPLSVRAIDILTRHGRQLDGAPVFRLSQDFVIREFRRACTAAGLKDLKFHDLRHEGITRLAKLMNLPELMRISGHKTTAMVMRYFNPTTEELRSKLG